MINSYAFAMKIVQPFEIPKLCKNSALLSVIVCVELFAIVISILISDDDFLQKLGSVSLYCQWWALLSVVLLCFNRQRINKLRLASAILVTCGCCMISYIGVELVTQLYIKSYAAFDWSRFFSLGVVTLIFTLMTLRLFAAFSLIGQRGRAESEMRVQALQSRIKPHFLFNCLNTISELINSQPQQAEEAVDNLAMLFRASIETESKFHSLESELSLCRRYVELERWRLAERLSIEWQVDIAEQGDWQIPKLILQPLVENAIVHGVTGDGNIQIEVDIRETKNHISIMVQNAKTVTVINADAPKGHGIAVENIRERLFVLYDDQQSFRVSDGPDNYKVIMRLPKQSKIISH